MWLKAIFSHIASKSGHIGLFICPLHYTSVYCTSYYCVHACTVHNIYLLSGVMEVVLYYSDEHHVHHIL